MKHFFKVSNLTLCIDNHQENLDENISLLSSTYISFPASNSDSILIIEENCFIIKINSFEITKHVKIGKRDLYQVFYAFISLTVNKLNQQILIHSSIVSKNNEGILIVGDYSSGKTTLANAFHENGYEINSADRSVCQIKNGQLFTIQGTKKINYNNIITYISDELALKTIKIKHVLFLEGISDNGELKKNSIVDKTRVKKRLFNSLINIFYAPFENFNDCMFDFVDNFYYNISKEISLLDIQFTVVRGDSNQIINLFSKGG